MVYYIIDVLPGMLIVLGNWGRLLIDSTNVRQLRSLRLGTTLMCGFSGFEMVLEKSHIPLSKLIKTLKTPPHLCTSAKYAAWET